MTDKALEYCARSIIRYLNGDKDKFRQLVDKAIRLNDCISCDCGNPMVDCKYEKRPAKLCTSCGKLWINGEVVKKCIVGRKIA